MDPSWSNIVVGGTTFQYCTDNVLGKGMFGVVNPAKLFRNEKLLQDNLCVKRIKTDEMTKDQKVKLERENEVLGKISNLGNKNLVTTLCIQSDDKWLYIFMEKCSRGDLKDLMHQKNNDFSPDEVIKIIGSIVNGYKGLQIYKIVHRDLKPANIIIDEEPVEGSEEEKQLVYKLADFGMSRVLDEALKNQAVKLTRVGSPLYMSPQVLLELPYKERTDVFSLGVIAHQLLHKGAIPYTANSQASLMNSVRALQNKPHSCEKCASANAPKELIQLIESMLRFNEQERPSWEELYKHPLLKQYITQTDHQTTYVPQVQVTTYNKKPQPTQSLPQTTPDRGMKNLEQTIGNNSLQDSMFLTDGLPVGEKLTKSQRIEKFIKILLKKGDQAFEAMMQLQQLFGLYPQHFDQDISLLFVVLVGYKYNTLLSCFGMLTYYPPYITPKITSIVKWESLLVGLNEFSQTNPNLYNQYKESVSSQIQYFFGLQNDLTRDYLQRTRGLPQEPWISQMLNNITTDYSPYLDAIRYIHQNKIRTKLNYLQSLVIPYPNHMLVFKIYYYLEMIMRIDQKFSFSQYLSIDEESIGIIPFDDDLCKELTNIYQEPIN